MDWIGVRKSISTEDLIDLQHRLGIELPKDYEQKIASINGGGLKHAYLEHPEYGKIPYSRNVLLDLSSVDKLSAIIKAISKNSNRYFPFASIGNGDYFCFDLKEDKVVLWRYESDSFLHICKSFTDLIQQLTVL